MKAVVYFLVAIEFTLALPPSVNWSQVRPHRHNVREDIATGKKDNLPNSRIIGGDEIRPHSAPYQAGVLGNGSSLCGGSLISTTRVLTAAHCTSDMSFVIVVLGAHALDSEETTQIRLNSSSIIIHEEYRVSLVKDLSLILLPSPVTLTDSIQTIPLAPATADSYEGSSAYLTGWGMTADQSSVSPVLRGVNLTVLSNKECTDKYFFLQPFHICTSGNGTVGACHCDSGGALVIDGVQVGIVSFGSSSCVDGSPTAFVRISSFRDWIEEHADL